MEGELCTHLCVWNKGDLDMFFLWLSIFLFAYGGIQLIELGFIASISLWWYVDSYKKIQMKTF
jgi:hypothetical protein